MYNDSTDLMQALFKGTDSDIYTATLDARTTSEKAPRLYSHGQGYGRGNG